MINHHYIHYTLDISHLVDELRGRDCASFHHFKALEDTLEPALHVGDRVGTNAVFFDERRGVLAELGVELSVVGNTFDGDVADEMEGLQG